MGDMESLDPPAPVGVPEIEGRMMPEKDSSNITVTNAQIKQIIDILGLSDKRVSELHLNARDGQALILRTDGNGMLMADGENLVIDTITITIQEEN